MCCFFLLHGVVLSLASNDVRSPFLPLRRATILRIVPSFGSRMIHVRRPAFCVPIVTFRLDRPAHHPVLLLQPEAGAAGLLSQPD